MIQIGFSLLLLLAALHLLLLTDGPVMIIVLLSLPLCRVSDTIGGAWCVMWCGTALLRLLLFLSSLSAMFSSTVIDKGATVTSLIVRYSDRPRVSDCKGRFGDKQLERIHERRNFLLFLLFWIANNFFSYRLLLIYLSSNQSLTDPASTTQLSRA